MIYKIIIDNKAKKILKSLPKLIRDRIVLKIDETKFNPYRYFKKLKQVPEYKLRIGNYRVIAQINDNQLIILILYLDLRKRIYKIF